MPIQKTFKSLRYFCLSSLLLLPLAIQAKVKDPCPDWGARVKSFPVAICQSANVQPSNGRTVRGRTIYFQDTGPVNASSRVLVIGTIHGDEQSCQRLPPSSGREFHHRPARRHHPPNLGRWHAQISGAHRRRA